MGLLSDSFVGASLVLLLNSNVALANDQVVKQITEPLAINKSIKAPKLLSNIKDARPQMASLYDLIEGEIDGSERILFTRPFDEQNINGFNLDSLRGDIIFLKIYSGENHKQNTEVFYDGEVRTLGFVRSDIARKISSKYINFQVKKHLPGLVDAFEYFSDFLSVEYIGTSEHDRIDSNLLRGIKTGFNYLSGFFTKEDKKLKQWEDNVVKPIKETLSITENDIERNLKLRFPFSISSEASKSYDINVSVEVNLTFSKYLNSNMIYNLNTRDYSITYQNDIFKRKGFALYAEKNSEGKIYGVVLSGYFPTI